jgi:Ankyrin repeat
MAASSLHETLLSACRTGTEPRAKEALQRGVSTDIRDEARELPLWCQSRWLRAPTATCIAIPHFMQAGNSPLMLASQEGHFSVVKLLLSKSASVDTSNKVGPGPLEDAGSC